jgi:adenylate kinase
VTRRVALLGLSGVGKSTLIGQVSEQTPLLHLQASSLIKAEQLHRAQSQDTSEALRTGPVLDNQALMVAAYNRLTKGTALPVVFDGHSVIDGRHGLVEIPSAVFEVLGLEAICILTADPAIIFERRRYDTGRERPHRDVDALAAQQAIAIVTAQRIAGDLNCPFHHFETDARTLLLQLLS